MERMKRPDQGAHYLLTAASIVVVIAGLKAASLVIVPFLIALFIAMLSFPLLNWLQSARVPTPVALLITLSAVLSVLAAVVLVVAGSISGFTEEAPKYKAQLQEMSSSTVAWLEAQGFQISPQVVTDFFDPARTLDLVTTGLKAGTAVLSNILLVFLTIGFLLAEAAGFPAKLQAAFGSPASSGRFLAIKQEVQHYLAIKAVTSLTTGSVVAVGLAIVGVDFPLLWGFIAFVANFIPTLGSIIAAVPPILLALVQLGTGHAVGVAAIFLAVNISIGSITEPHLLGRRLGLSTLVVFLSLLFWGWIWGPLGMLLSVPLTMVVKIMLENTEDLKWVATLLGSTPRKRDRPTTADA
jgi:AI-2 transport protein TqsA